VADHRTLIRVLTLTTVLGCAGLAIVVERSARRDVAYGAQYATSPDSAVRTRAAYHAAHGQLLLDQRWSLRGHGTLSVLGILAGGVALAAAARLGQGGRS
jgi:hypothetical protein